MIRGYVDTINCILNNNIIVINKQPNKLYEEDGNVTLYLKDDLDGNMMPASEAYSVADWKEFAANPTRELADKLVCHCHQ